MNERGIQKQTILITLLPWPFLTNGISRMKQGVNDVDNDGVSAKKGRCFYDDLVQILLTQQLKLVMCERANSDKYTQVITYNESIRQNCQ